MRSFGEIKVARMRYLLPATTLVTLLGASAPALAFDVRTHSAMTSEAMAASKFGRDANASVVTRRLGLVDYPPSLTTRFPTLVTCLGFSDQL